MSLRNKNFESLEFRRLLSSGTIGRSLESTHLVGCPCGVCGNGTGSFIEQPLTAEEKRLLHGDDALSAAKQRSVVTPPAPPLVRPSAIQTSSVQSTPGAAVGQRPAGALTNRIIFTAAGHGFTAANTTSGNFSTQRGLTNGMVEDMGNFDQMTQFVHYAWNAGATIVPTRPVGVQPNEVVLDNTSAGVTFSGTWTNGGAGVGNGTVTFFSLTGSSPTARYREAVASATESAVARYTPTIPQAGFYPVYAWASNSSAYVNNNLPDQLYRITHTGGKTEVKVDHRKIGKGWVYLGTYHFDAGTSGYLEISNKSSTSGRAIADAVRFGNGMGDIDRGGGISGQSREDENSLYWIQKQAEHTYQSVNNAAPALIPASTYRGGNTLDIDANVGAPPRWSAYMNNSAFGDMTDRLFLSYHSNAAGGRGTIGLYNGNNNPNTKTPFQFEWALYAAREVNDDLVALSGQLEFPWFNRTTNAQLTLDRSDIEFGEINNLSVDDEFDATILEVAFHDDATDAALMRDPKVRQWVARSSVQAAVRYFNDPAIGGGGALAFAPDAPTNVRAITQANGDVVIRWDPPVPGPGTGAAAAGYVLETSTDGYGFDGGVVVPGGASNTFTIPAGSLVASQEYFFRVISTSAGGWSPASAVVGARRNPSGTAPILIVNGFDRMHRTINLKQTAPISGPGTSATFERVRPRFSNSLDYVVQAGKAIAAYPTPIGFDSVQNETVINGQIDLTDYAAVIWLSGEESTLDDTFNPTEQSLVTNYINGGGKFFVSGSEIGYELVSQGGGASFFNNVLRAGYASDDANTYAVTGAAGSIFAGLSLSFDNGEQFYDVEFPDRLHAVNGSTVAMTYVGGAGGNAAIQWSGAGGAQVVLLAFPFETITTEAHRSAVMFSVLQYFGFALVAPEPGAPDLVASNDTGTSSTDNLTNLNNASPASALQFTINGTVVNAVVTIYADGTPIGSAVASGSSTTVTTDGSTTLADGAHLITATQTIAGVGTSPISLPLIVTIDTVAPTLSAVFAFATAHELAISFSEYVGLTLDVTDVQLQNLTTSAAIAPNTMGLAYNGGSNIATITFPGQPSARLPDGNYQLTIAAASLTDVAGNALPADHLSTFRFLTGDANNDGTVNLSDFNILAGNFGQSPRDFTQGDFNYDGSVTLADFNILASKFGQSLAPAAARSTAAFTEARARNRIADDIFSSAPIV